jgi:23S rRNA-/tRNA-specific pseudouridylate synthase
VVLFSTTGSKEEVSKESRKDLVDDLDWIVVEEYPIPDDGIDLIMVNDDGDEFNKKMTDSTTSTSLDNKTIERLQINRYNMTVPVALYLLDAKRFPSLSKARKACRQGKIDILVAQDDVEDESSNNDQQILLKQQRRRQCRARVNDRVGPSDVILRKEIRRIVENTDYGSDTTTTTSTTTSLNQQYDVCSLVEPYFMLEIVYEDDFMAIVNKPAGVLVYPQEGRGRNNILFALPHVLWKPSQHQINVVAGENDDVVLDQPIPVHRLDFATSGLLVVGKTKNSVRRLSQQFEFRKAKKTYTAMVYGIPRQPSKGILSSATSDWNLAQSIMDGKNCTTWWRLIKSYQYHVPSTTNTTVTTMNIPISIVELKPETGRYHQLRRQMAYLYNTPIVGDPIYISINANATTQEADKGYSENIDDDIVAFTSNRRYHRGLMLCSNLIQIEHPFYNTPVVGQEEWKRSVAVQQHLSTADTLSSSRLYETTSSTITGDNNKGNKKDNEKQPRHSVIMVEARIDVPKKFGKFQRLLQRMSDEGNSKA